MRWEVRSVLRLAFRICSRTFSAAASPCATILSRMATSITSSSRSSFSSGSQLRLYSKISANSILRLCCWLKSEVDASDVYSRADPCASRLASAIVSHTVPSAGVAPPSRRFSECTSRGDRSTSTVSTSASSPSRIGGSPATLGAAAFFFSDCTIKLPSAPPVMNQPSRAPRPIAATVTPKFANPRCRLCGFCAEARAERARRAMVPS
mmetsp:Transcript_41806/g.99228  ORF Transcript_41806/g.99228 Transcript_41806/m.99228 type:complete len:208 (-) Transcript_41806:93-716(-)